MVVDACSVLLLHGIEALTMALGFDHGIFFGAFLRRHRAKPLGALGVNTVNAVRGCISSIEEEIPFACGSSHVTPASRQIGRQSGLVHLVFLLPGHTEISTRERLLFFLFPSCRATASHCVSVCSVYRAQRVPWAYSAILAAERGTPLC